jgi:hypothetical protein
LSVIQKHIEQEVRLQKFRARCSSNKKWGLCCRSTGRLQLENCVSGHKTHNLVCLLLLLNITIVFIVLGNRSDKKYYNLHGSGLFSMIAPLSLVFALVEKYFYFSLWSKTKSSKTKGICTPRSYC